jgi:hypothetical protein
MLATCMHFILWCHVHTQLAHFSLVRAAERIAAAKRQRADPDADQGAEERASEEGVRAVRLPARDPFVLQQHLPPHALMTAKAAAASWCTLPRQPPASCTPARSVWCIQCVTLGGDSEPVTGSSPPLEFIQLVVFILEIQCLCDYLVSVQVVMQSSEIGDERPVAACAFAPDGATLATASWSGRLKLWRAPGSEKLLTVQAHDTRITGAPTSASIA